MKIIKILSIILVLGTCCVGFFYVNSLNYIKHKEIQRAIVNHPELLPDKEMAKFTSIGYKNLVADLYWLQAIQYIGGNAISAEYKKYLFVMLDLITDLNPYFENPYIIGQLLLPDYNERYEDSSQEEQDKTIRQGETLGLKAMKNFCNLQTVQKIIANDNLQEIWNTPELLNPCTSYTAPYYLAYIYFFYLNDPLQASNYYKVASAQDDAPEGSKILAAIMQWKWGNREKSLYMFLSLAESVESKESVCKVLSQELQNVYLWLSSWDLVLDGTLVRNIEETRKQVFPEFSEEIEEEVLGDAKCTNFLNKAIREINLLYIETANREFQANHPEWFPARNAQGLFEEGYIDFLPTDYQQYEDYGIIYEYDYERKRYDYSMGSY